MEIIILASGSKGNALLVLDEESIILVDLGISYTSLTNKLKQFNLDVTNINEVLITHEHSDHIKGLKTFSKNNPNIKITLTKGTFDGLPVDIKSSLTNFEFINNNDKLKIKNFNITVYSLSHDAKDPVGFVFENNNKKIVLATDTGYIDHNYYELLAKADLYVLESNHSAEMLMNSSRPFYLKQRILNEKGHLSNRDAAILMNDFIKDIEKSIWVVAHISEDCNTIYQIEKSIVDIIEDPTKIEVFYTSQESLEKITL